MPDSATALPIVLAGAALLATAGLRLLGLGLSAMPVRLAAGAAVASVAIMGFGAVGFVRPADPGLGAQLPLRPDDASPQPEPLEPAEGDQSTPRGAIEGSVRSWSGDAVAGATVALRRFDRTSLLGTATATTAADGAFRFEALPATPTDAYRIETDFGGARFSSRLIVLGDHALEQTHDLVVAEAAEDASGITVVSASTVLIGGPDGGLQVLEILEVDNATTRAYVGGLELPLVEGASGLDPRRGLDRSRLALRGGGLVSLSPLLPGRSQIVYSYTAPMPRSGLRIERNAAYPADDVSVLASGPLAVSVEGLAPAGEVTLDGAEGEGSRRYRRFAASGVAAGTTFAATVSPAGPGPMRFVVVGLAAAAALAVVAAPLILRRRRGRRPSAAPAPGDGQGNDAIGGAGAHPAPHQPARTVPGGEA